MATNVVLVVGVLYKMFKVLKLFSFRKRRQTSHTD